MAIVSIDKIECLSCTLWQGHAARAVLMLTRWFYLWYSPISEVAKPIRAALSVAELILCIHSLLHHKIIIFSQVTSRTVRDQQFVAWRSPDQRILYCQVDTRVHSTEKEPSAEGPPRVGTASPAWSKQQGYMRRESIGHTLSQETVESGRRLSLRLGGQLLVAKYWR